MSNKPPARSQIEEWQALPDYLRLCRACTNINVVFCAPKGYADRYQWKTGDSLLYMGDVHGMGGHGVYADKNGRIWWGYHTDNFYMEPDEGENE